MKITKTETEVRVTSRFAVEGAEPALHHDRPYQPARLEIEVLTPDQGEDVIFAVLSGPVVLRGGSLGTRQVFVRDRSGMPTWAQDFLAEFEDSGNW